ncbi:MAG: hypothetical protein QM764_08955 [Chitinophagaceae bacterium]
MNKEEVIIHKLNVTRLLQPLYFQVTLPADTERIIGIETGAFRKRSGVTASDLYAYFGSEGSFSEFEYDGTIITPTLFTIKKTDTIGRLTLYSPASKDVFYQEEVKQEDSAFKFADFTQFGIETFGQWSHNTKRYETNISVKNCSPVIEGYYKDSWGFLYNYHVIYELNIYIWIKKDNP